MQKQKVKYLMEQREEERRKAELNLMDSARQDRPDKKRALFGKQGTGVSASSKGSSQAARKSFNR